MKKVTQKTKVCSRGHKYTGSGPCPICWPGSKKLNKKLTVKIRHSDRARRLRLTVYSNGSVVLTSPVGLAENIAERFIREKAQWLISKLKFFSTRVDQFPATPALRFTRRDYLKYKPQALVLVVQKVAQLNAIYGYSYNRVSVRNQKTCWGSCSRKGNLNFNYKILFLSERARDYVIAHELCHLKEFNHSKRFWELVAQTSPDYLEIRKELKRNGVTPRSASPAGARVS